MSRAIVDSSFTGVKPFSDVLEPAESALLTAGAHGNRRLGRTASMLQRLKDEAAAKGFAEGIELGSEQGREVGKEQAYQELLGHVVDFASALHAAVDRVDTALEGWYTRSEERLAQLAVVIAARIVGREIQLDSEAILTITKDAIREVTHADEVVIRLNPFDVPVIKEHLTEIQAVAASVRRVEVFEDPNLEGGCRIESDGGAIDASIRGQLELALEHLRGEP